MTQVQCIHNWYAPGDTRPCPHCLAEGCDTKCYHPHGTTAEGLQKELDECYVVLKQIAGKNGELSGILADLRCEYEALKARLQERS